MADTPELSADQIGALWATLLSCYRSERGHGRCSMAGHLEAALREAEARGFAKGLEDFAVLAMKRADHYEVKHEDAKDAKDAAALAMAAAAITWHAAADTARSLAAQSPPDPSAPPEVAAAEPKP
jgi:hypothetical protein